MTLSLAHGLLKLGVFSKDYKERELLKIQSSVFRSIVADVCGSMKVYNYSLLRRRACSFVNSEFSNKEMNAVMAFTL